MEGNIFLIFSFARQNYRGFHKLDEIDNNVNIGIRGFNTWKQKIM